METIIRIEIDKNDQFLWAEIRRVFDECGYVLGWAYEPTLFKRGICRGS